MTKRLYDILFVLFSVLFVAYTARKPIYNWDMIAYMGVVEEYSVHNIQKVHDVVYSTLQHEVPADVYEGLTHNEKEREDCLASATAFHEELSFFRAKPLYTGFVFLLHKAGCPFVLSTLIPSIISAFLIMMICYIWLCAYLERPMAFVMSVLMALLPVFSDLERYSTPDALSNMLILLSLYLIATDKKRKWLLVTLVLCLFARVDNFIYVIAALFFVYLKDLGKVGYKLAVGVGIALAGVFLIPMLFGNSFNWFTKFAFLFSFADYAAHWKAVLYDFRQPPYIFLVIISYFLFRCADKRTAMLMRIIVFTIVTRMILFPSVQERFFASYEFAITIMFIGYMNMTYKMQLPPRTDAAAEINI